MSAERNLTDTELLSAYIDGQLTSEERLALEDRLQTDAELRRQLVLLRSTVDLIKDLPQLKAPRDFRLTRQMASRGASNRRVYTFSLLSAAAAIVLLFVGFTLLMTNSSLAPNALSRGVSNFDGDEEDGVVLLPTNAPFGTQAPSLVFSPTTGYFAAGEEQINDLSPSESESAQGLVQQAQTTNLGGFPTETPLDAILQSASTAANTSEIAADTAGSTDQEATNDQRTRDFQDEASGQAAAPASVPPVDAFAAPTQGAATGSLTLQESQPSTSTSFPTLLPTLTTAPTETASETPANTPPPTATLEPTFAPAPTTPTMSTATFAMVLIVIALILLVVSLSALFFRRRR